jgi:hypothetical protein
MSVADPFAALGFLPFCHESLPELDVTGWDHVAPLTLAELMKVYWSLESITGSATATIPAPFSLDVSVGGGSLSRAPFERVCGPGTYSDSDSEESDEDPFPTANSVFLANSGTAGISGNIFRLMDDDEFIGYGIGYNETDEFGGTGMSGVAECFATAYAATQSCILVSASNDAGASADYPYTNYSAGIVTFGGIDFVKVSYGTDFGGGDKTLTADITDVGFFTYPAP